MHKFYQAFIVILAVTTLTSCGSKLKDVTYFNNVVDKEKFMAPHTESRIRPNDLLDIKVTSINSAASELFNLPSESSIEASTASGNVTKISGYLVDSNGFIKFPFLGKLEVSGLTKLELENFLESQLKKRQLLVEPSVSIRNLNFKVSVLGEVKNPSVLNVPNEKISIMEALGRAGDITIDGNRTNVLIIRELEVEEESKFITRLDLTSDQVLESPYYFLKPNDIIYVEPTKNKLKANSVAMRWIPVVLSTISLAIITITSIN